VAAFAIAQELDYRSIMVYVKLVEYLRHSQGLARV